MSTKKKWDLEMRIYMYGRLLEEFGPFCMWRCSSHPSACKDEYNKLLESLVDYFEKYHGVLVSVGGVRNQIDWAIRNQKRIKHRGHTSNYILNRAAAIHTGFLKTCDLPDMMTMSTNK